MSLQPTPTGSLSYSCGDKVSLVKLVSFPSDLEFEPFLLIEDGTTTPIATTRTRHVLEVFWKFVHSMEKPFDGVDAVVFCPELADQILRWVAQSFDPQTLATCRLLCKKWGDWAKPYLYQAATIASSKSLSLVGHRSTRIKEIRRRWRALRIQGGDWLHTGSSMILLKRLRVTDLTKVVILDLHQDKRVYDMLEHLKNIDDLTLTGRVWRPDLFTALKLALGSRTLGRLVIRVGSHLWLNHLDPIHPRIPASAVRFISQLAVRTKPLRLPEISNTAKILPAELPGAG